MAQWHATMPYSGNSTAVCASNKATLLIHDKISCLKNSFVLQKVWPI
ncbi:hypothetical protein BT93_L4188 [Corymbia citriodora subsp. variegata]|uniref:Uncharacterized protein n=1 Tax=Corymbia citriodora subsp. variegata TaxID=360336 RepID=A0A8T0CL67_CORYI|nr:hypothetical protein BT93_L4188 [Corymbia citriodora subsp. variegata]